MSPGGRQTTVVVTMGTRDHPLDVSLRPVLGSPGLVDITFRHNKELLCRAIVTLAAIQDALRRCEAELSLTEADGPAPGRIQSGDVT